MQRPPAPVLSSASEGKAGALLLASKARFGVPARRNTTASRLIAIISAHIALGTWSRHLLPPECSPEHKPAAVARLLRGLKYRVQPLLLLAEHAGTLASSPTRCRGTCSITWPKRARAGRSLPLAGQKAPARTPRRQVSPLAAEQGGSAASASRCPGRSRPAART